MAAPAYRPAANPHLPPREEPAPPSASPVYDGRAGRIFGIALANALLGVLTLGFYRFWGKTRLRRYLWSGVRLWDDPLVYSGRGMELFVGFLLVLLILIPLGLLGAAIDLVTAGWGRTAQIGATVAYYVLLYFLIGVAVFRARRYRLSRTHWREIRAGQTGSSLRYGLMWLGYGLLTVATVGLASPVGQVRLQTYLAGHTWLGNRRFALDARAGEMFGKWFLCWLLVLPSLGFSLLWFAAYRTRYFAASTRYENLRFALPVRFRDLLWILVPYIAVIGGLFGLVALVFGDATATLAEITRGGGTAPAGVEPQLVFAGLGYLFVLLVAMPTLSAVMLTHRYFALYCGRLAILGTPDFAAIAQGARGGPQTGEGLADAFDVGGGL